MDGYTHKHTATVLMNEGGSGRQTLTHSLYVVFLFMNPQTRPDQKLSGSIFLSFLFPNHFLPLVARGFCRAWATGEEEGDAGLYKMWRPPPAMDVCGNIKVRRRRRRQQQQQLVQRGIRKSNRGLSFPTDPQSRYSCQIRSTTIDHVNTYGPRRLRDPRRRERERFHASLSL